ncbi:lipopolysaccharide export system permease protein [Saccharicrinis carchari]|uniref:Lipopolysaccharide export system permease protein n=1 Tax=Saccharicrinis carchari TaxID=1168039 RepID=A0A521C1F6_SACCC|nr:LptF/LptG family permease [Saccharicrinis carchari]SMO53279.1 lipopolysaccharide export system permease protein [Saccharicrinis carchari]
MKKLHLFILKSYVSPLVMTFFISLFILVMQFLWKYVDDMVGKGLEVHVLAELIFYASLQVVPMALPLAILLASLMSFGNLGENYELTALKSAGISLPRIMSPLIILTIVVCFGAFKFSNNILPVANLKLWSLMWSVRQASPEFDIKEKVFYDGLTDFSIKIERKSKTDDMLYDIMIYDHRNNMARNSNVTLADSGKLEFAEDKKSLRLTLWDGVTYDEKANLEKRSVRRKEKQQFRIDHFKKQVALMPMQGMDFNRYDEGLFKSHNRMKNLKQLSTDSDSLQRQRDKEIGILKPRVESNYFTMTKSMNRRIKRDLDIKIAKDSSIQNSYKEKPIEAYGILNLDSVFNSFETQTKVMVLGSAVRKARNTKSQIDQQMIEIEKINYQLVRHKIEWHRKFTLPFACFIFFFIGAPLGAIIRKGGLGMPVVISILFFIVYYIIDTFGLKVSKEEVWPPYMGMWLSSVVLFPIGVFLTYKAATDSAILNPDAYIIFFQKLWSSIKKKK